MLRHSQFCADRNTVHLFRSGVVPDPVLVAVGVEDDRALAVLLLQTIGVELGLLLADAWVLAGALASTRPSGLLSSPRST